MSGGDNKGRRFVFVVADYYGDIAAGMIQSGKDALKGAGLEVEDARVPGALEIPQALEFIAGGGDGIVAMAALGCVVRGETYHFEIVSDICARGILQVQLQSGVPVGNGVLTVDTMAQAKARMNDKAKQAVDAALRLSALKQRYQQQTKR